MGEVIFRCKYSWIIVVQRAAIGDHHLANVCDQLAYVIFLKPVLICSRSYQSKYMSVEEANFLMMTPTYIICIGKTHALMLTEEFVPSQSTKVNEKSLMAQSIAV